MLSHEIYLIEAVCHPGIYKVGFSNSAIVRMEQGLQPYCPCELRIRAVFRSMHPKRDEADMHMALHSRRLHGEWFRLSDEDVAWFLRITAMSPSNRAREVEARIQTELHLWEQKMMEEKREAIGLLAGGNHVQPTTA